MMRGIILFLTLVLSSFGKDLYWLKTFEKKGSYQLVGLSKNMVSELSFTTPDLKSKKGSLDSDKFYLPKSFWGGYHLLRADIKRGKEFFTATRYIYKHGKPSKISPEKLITLNNKNLEILPHPLPREHDRYTENKEYRFQVFFQGEKLESFQGRVITSNGSEEIFQGKNGEFKISVPQDARGIQGRKDRRRSSNFTLSLSHKNYHSSLSAPYYINPSDYYQKRDFGTFMIIVGFIIGLVVMWRRHIG